MNKKFSTLMAACLAAGALVLPADMFAQIRYTNGLTYADQQTETKNAEEAGESVEYYIVLNDGTKDYVAVVQDDYSLKAVEFAAANMEQTVKITKTADGFTVATGDNFLGFSTSGWGNSTIFQGAQIGYAGDNVWIKGVTKSVALNTDNMTFSVASDVNNTFEAKAVTSAVLEDANKANVASVVTGDITGVSYILMENGRALTGSANGTATWGSYVKGQNQYWTIEVVDNGDKTGVAKFKNKETGKYLADATGKYITADAERNADDTAWKFSDNSSIALSAKIEGWNVIALGAVNQSGTSLKASQLTSITGGGFEASIKKFIDGDQKDKDLAGNPFVGLLKPVQFKDLYASGTAAAELEPATGYDYMLQDEDGNIIVVDLDKTYAAGATEKKYVLKAIDPEVLANALKDSKAEINQRYAYYFTFNTADDFVIGTNTKISSVFARNNQNTAYYLGCTDVNEVPTLTAEIYSETFQADLTIKVGTFNTIDVKKLLGNTPAFFTVTNVNTKAKYSDNYGKVLGLKSTSEWAYIKSDEALVGYPETQWAITYSNGTLTLANRERPSVKKTYTASQLYKVAGKDNVFAVLDGSAKTDTIEFKANTNYTEADGFLRLNAAELRDQSYYVAAASSVYDNVAYLVENHGKNHQVGLDTDKANATEWNLAASMFRGLNNLEETIEYRPDTIQVKSILGYYKADGSYATTVDTDGEGTVMLKMLAYSFQNDANSEYLAYVGGESNRYATGDFGATVGYKNDKSKADIFVIKTVGEDLYNLIPLDGQNAVDVNKAEARNWEALSSLKMYSGDGATKGILNNTPMYSQTENDLFVIEKKDAPEYRKVAMADTISIFRNEDAQDVLFEKGEFLGTATSTGFEKANPALFVDTAYVNRPYNNRWEYLLAVNAKHWDSKVECDIPGHPKHEADTTTGRFLVNLMDSAYVYNETHLHNNKFINEEDGEVFAKLGFVEGYHTHDTLYLKRPNGTYDKIAMDREDYSHSIAKFAFRYVDQNEGSFVIETGCKDWNGGEATSEVKTGYLKWLNGTLVVVNNIEAAEIFNMNEDESRTPTANEAISAGNVVVAGTNGAVVVKGAEGKNVIVSTILGKVVANEVISSDNAQIATPAGIVVVSVDGESFKVVVK